MKRFVLACLVCLMVLSACGSNTTIKTGPSVYLGPITISASIDNTGVVTLDQTFSLIAGDRDLGASWDVAFETTLNEAKDIQYALFILYRDQNGELIQDEYAINRPFDIKFDQTQWVEEIKTDGNGNIIVSVKPNPLPAAVPVANDAPATSAPVVESAPLTSSSEPAVQNPTPLPILGKPCPDAPPTRIEVGDMVLVTTTDGDPLILRSSPVAAGDNWVLKINRGIRLRVLDGPTCSNNFVYWRVKMIDGSSSGWVAEGDSNLYFLAPVY